MPTIGVKQEVLFQLLGKSYTEDEFNDLCFDFGLELDEVTSERAMVTKEQGDEKKAAALSDEIIFRIDIPANRYDLLCAEGLTRALLVFQSKIEIPLYRSLKPKNMHQLILKPNTAKIRPYAVAAIIRGIDFTDEVYQSFIDLQDKLHQNLCRKRTLVAIGTHDLDTIQGPFIYDALPPSDIKFVPLNQTKEMTGNELMDFYSTDSHLKPYLPIIRDSPVYPVITDQNGVVLSLPPIINGNHSKIIKGKTRNVFIECTATDLQKAKITLDIMVCMFSQYCTEKFTAESVEVINPNRSKVVYPELSYREESVAIDYINKSLGTSLSSKKTAELLTKMGLKSIIASNEEIKVIVPPTRHDVLHACDIMEDVAIAYGYNNLTKALPSSYTVAKQFHINELTDQLRHEVARCGFTEGLTFSLCSRDDISVNIRSPKGLEEAVKISNPKTLEFQVARTTLIPGLLKTLQANKSIPLPIKIFEITDVVIKDENKDVGARNERRLCAVNCNTLAQFEVVHGLLDRIMQVMEVPYSPDGAKKNGYTLTSSQDSTFLPGRAANIMKGNLKIGRMGVIHPEVLLAYELTNPCSLLELNIEAL